MGMAAEGSRAVEVQSNVSLGEEDKEGEVQLRCSELGTTFLPLNDSVLCF